MDAPEAACEEREWLALPTGVLQLIMCLASTSQTPGSCMASLVCRTWRYAATGCSGMRLLFHAGHLPTDEAFAAWLAGNAQCLVAVMVSSSSSNNALLVLEALAHAAEAAQAAGRPLPLHTLRVLAAQANKQIAGRLLAALPNLRCLQLGMKDLGWFFSPAVGQKQGVSDLAPLQQATQLQELYLQGPDSYQGIDADVAELLPPSLRRLSWAPFGHQDSAHGTLSHLTQLTFLQLWHEPFGRLGNHHLPASLQQLELWDPQIDGDVVEEHRAVLTGYQMEEMEELTYGDMLEQLARLTNIRTLRVDADDLQSRAGCAAIKQLTNLSALTLWAGREGAGRSSGTIPALATAASLGSLRRLHLFLYGMPNLTGLAAVTQLTQLRLVLCEGEGSAEQRQALTAALSSLVGLRWLSVPSVLLWAGKAWLGSLQQLQVLVLQCGNGVDVASVAHVGSTAWHGMSWVEALPPRLQVLAVSGMTAERAAALQLRRRLQRALASRGCEVVVGVDLDEAADPTQQLAGLPVALQQVLQQGLT